MKKIFIIEDDITLLRMLERIFVIENFVVEDAREGADAVAKLYMMEELPSAIILDLLIPVLSGVEVLKLIKKSDKLKDIPVVILSNLSPSHESEKHILSLGALMYLRKSENTPQQVAKKVAEILGVAMLSSDAPEVKIEK